MNTSTPWMTNGARIHDVGHTRSVRRGNLRGHPAPVGVYPVDVTKHGRARRVVPGELITVEWRAASGLPRAMTVYDVLEHLASGMTEDEILADFPDLVREEIRARLSFAAFRERRLSSPAA